ncbi:MAG TPA: hypothetical protein VGJ30_07545, partial [Candidatus Angelobacter sp.]
FKGIQVTLAVMARAVINGRVDCKTAGRLVVHLQMLSKLLWVYHRGHRGTQREKDLTTKGTHSTSLSQAQGRSGLATEHEESKSLSRINTNNADRKRQKSNEADITSPRINTEHRRLMVVYDRPPGAIHDEDFEAAVAVKARMFLEGHRGWRDGPCPCQETRAA